MSKVTDLILKATTDESLAIQFANQNDFQAALNVAPPATWCKVHPQTKTAYIPIQRIEWLLTQIFVQWRCEILSTVVMANSIVMTVRLHVFNPISKQWECQDGIGAAPISTEKGAAATDFTKILTMSVMQAAPAAKSYAIKDAAECFGKIFGKDLNRKDEVMYDGMEGRFNLEEKEDAPKLPALTPEHPMWNGAKKAVINGATREQAEAKFTISDEVWSLLNEPYHD